MKEVDKTYKREDGIFIYGILILITPICFLIGPLQNEKLTTIYFLLVRVTTTLIIYIEAKSKNKQIATWIFLAFLLPGLTTILMYYQKRFIIKGERTYDEMNKLNLLPLREGDKPYLLLGIFYFLFVFAFSIFIKKTELDLWPILYLASFIIRILAMANSTRIAREKNRSMLIYGFWSILTPGLALITISLLSKKNNSLIST